MAVQCTVLVSPYILYAGKLPLVKRDDDDDCSLRGRSNRKRLCVAAHPRRRHPRRRALQLQSCHPAPDHDDLNCTGGYTSPLLRAYSCVWVHQHPYSPGGTSSRHLDFTRTVRFGVTSTALVDRPTDPHRHPAARRLWSGPTVRRPPLCVFYSAELHNTATPP